jgi:hypothetical protein
MINADVDGSPAGFLAFDVDALPLAGAGAASPFESGCALFFFLAMVFVHVPLRGSLAGTCSDAVVLSIKFEVGAHRSSLAPSSPAGHGTNTDEHPFSHHAQGPLLNASLASLPAL